LANFNAALDLPRSNLLGDKDLSDTHDDKIQYHQSIIMDKHFYTAQIIRFTAASISLICSSIMAIMISISEDGFTKPYRRIIFGLSVSDILQSVGIIVSPFAAPRGTPGSTWAVGNTSSCEAVGFILTAGGTMLPMYTFMLTSYFLLRVKYKMTIKDYAKKVEWKFHAFIIIWNVTSSIIALVQDSYNSARAGSLCTMREYPLNCHSDPEVAGQCVRGEDSRKYSMILVFVPGLTSLIGMIVSLVILNVYVAEHERIHTNSENSSFCCQKITQTIKHLFCFGAPPEVDGSEPPAPVQSQECIRQRSYARAALIQSSLYLISFSVTYFFLAFDYLFYVVSNGDNPNWTFLPISIFWPIGGLFNIMVYTRPKVLSLMDRHPDFPKFVLFLLVVVSGGEAPEEAAIEAALRSLELEQAAAPGAVTSGNNMEEVFDDDLPSNACFDRDRRVLSSDLSLSQGDERKKSGFFASTMSLDP